MKLDFKLRKLYQGPMTFDGFAFDALITLYRRRHETREVPVPIEPDEPENRPYKRHYESRDQYYLTFDLWLIKLRFDWKGGWHDNIENA